MSRKGRQSKKTNAINHTMYLYSKTSDDWVAMRPYDVGDMKHSARTVDHSGWMICDGRSLSRADYSELFGVIGTSYGNVDGASFNLPDCRGRVIAGIGQAGVGMGNHTMGQKLGEETHTLTIAEMPSHSHTVTDPGHAHSYVNNTNDQGTDNAFNSETAADQADLAQTTGSSTTGITLGNTGGGQAFNVIQPTIYVGNVFIFAAQNAQQV